MQNRLIAHAQLVNRYGAQKASELLPFILRMEEEILARLAKEGSSIRTKQRLSVLLQDTRGMISDMMGGYTAELEEELSEFIREELTFNDKQFRNVEHITPAPDQVVTAATNTPMVLSNQSVTLAQATKALQADTIQKVNSFITGGFYQGLTTQEISRNVRIATGSTRQNADAIVRTSVNFLSNETRQQFYSRNTDIVQGYVIVATLDSRTSDICKDLDGREVKFTDSYQPQPPFHYNCRTTTRPLLDPKYDFLQSGQTRASKGAEGGKQVPVNETYYEWLNRQPSAIQDEALGPTRGKIFRNAGLSPKEFKNAMTNRLSKPLTLKQMRRKDAKIDEYLE